MSNFTLGVAPVELSLNLNILLLLDFHHTHENHVLKTWKSQQYTMCWGFGTQVKHLKY